MKKKIPSIFLLITFLGVLGHEVIPHYHDTKFERYSFLRNIEKGHSHKHDEKHHHHEHDTKPTQKKQHKHHFPQHFHFVTTNSFDFVKTNTTENKIVFNDVAFLLYVGYFPEVLYKPPGIQYKYFISKPHLITNLFEPAGNGLRAPPSIA